MIDYNLDRQTGVLHVRPAGPLRKDDFAELAREVDPYIEQAGGLGGMIIQTARFPGWEDLGAAVRHVRFVRNHHQKIRKVALVTDSPLGAVAERVASHFLSAEIRRFGSDELNAAREWVQQP